MKNTINLKGTYGENESEVKAEFEQGSVPPKKKVTMRGLLKNKKCIALLVVIILGIAALGDLLAANNEWRAVFLTNNQVYFGKFWNMPFMRTIDLSDVYYLQAAQPIQPSDSQAQPQTQLKVVKLGNEIHGPKSEMHIPMNQVLFWEGLRDDSALVKTIESSK